MNILCLGDSYTIGELVSEYDNFPNQLKRILENKNKKVGELKIIAKTGDTTFELIEKINDAELGANYDYVTLLIGVNNQYRNLSLKDFALDFELLINKAIAFAKGNYRHVVVLSIPDWGMTPFNKDRDVKTVSKEIDAFNAIKKNIALTHDCNYIDITESTRTHAQNPSFLASDLLHPGAKEYAIWANLIEKLIQ
jgi:lysophospholipase L1-like esterase